MKMHSFHFDFSKVIATSIYIDLGRLLLFSVYNCIAVCGHPLVCQFFFPYLWAVNLYMLMDEDKPKKKRKKAVAADDGAGEHKRLLAIGDDSDG